MQRERLDKSLFQTEIHNSTSPFANIEAEILAIDKACFPNTFTNRIGKHEEWFSNAHNTIVLLKLGNEIVGFTIARPEIEGRKLDKDTCNVSLTTVSPKFQRNGLARLLMDKLRECLKFKGFTYWERNLAVENGWAKSFIEHEGDRILELGEPRMTEFGLKQYVKRRL